MFDRDYIRSPFLFAALSVAILLCALAWKFGEGKQVSLQNSVTTPEILQPRLSESDSDQDGLPDWQEVLLGLDPRNNDSDGDGKPDQSFISTTTSEIKTPSDILGESLISQYVLLKNAGAYNEERGEKLGNSLASNLAVNTPFIPYTTEELTIKKDVSATFLAQHRKRVQEVMEPFLAFTEPEFVLYAQYIDSQDSSYLIQLKERGSLYKEVAKNMMSVSVPQDGAETYLSAINSLAFFGTVLESMAFYSNDPVASLSLLRTYNEAEQYLSFTMGTLSTYYNKGTGR